MGTSRLNFGGAVGKMTAQAGWSAVVLLVFDGVAEGEMFRRDVHLRSGCSRGRRRCRCHQERTERCQQLGRRISYRNFLHRLRSGSSGSWDSPNTSAHTLPRIRPELRPKDRRRIHMQGNRMLLPSRLARQDKKLLRLIWNRPSVSPVDIECCKEPTHTTRSSVVVAVTVTTAVEVDTTVSGTTVVAVMVVVDCRKVEQNELAATE
jgi:hypothetical protein